MCCWRLRPAPRRPACATCTLCAAPRRLLPPQDRVIDGVWSNGLHRYPSPERELTQMVRTARPNAPVAGVSLIEDGALLTSALVRVGRVYLPGLRATASLAALLKAAGLRDLRYAHEGSFPALLGPARLTPPRKHRCFKQTAAAS